MGILINTGFDLGSSSPIDNRTVKNTTDERDALISDGLVYENLKVYCKDTQKEYRWTGTEWETVDGGSGGTAIDDTQASNTTTYSSNKITDLITEATAGKDLGNLLIVDNASEMSTLATKDNLGKSVLYTGDDTSSYTKGETYELYWNAITINYLNFAYSPTVKLNFVKIQEILGSRTSLTVTGEYGYQGQATWNITTNIGMSGGGIGNYGITSPNSVFTVGDKFSYTYNNSNKDSYKWIPVYTKPSRILSKEWYNIDTPIIYDGVERSYKRGRIYKLSSDNITISSSNTEISNLTIDKKKFINNCDLRGTITFTWHSSGKYFTRVQDYDSYTTQYTKEQLNNWGITYSGDITTNGSSIVIKTSKDSSISNWVWKDVTDIVEVPTKTSELTNDSNYQTAKQVNSAVTTEIAKVETELKGNIEELSSNLGELEKNVKFDADDLNTVYVPNKTITVRTNKNTKNLPQSSAVNFLVTSFAYIEGQYCRITQYCYENSENLSCATYVRRGISNAGESSITWSDWQELATMDKVADIPNSELTNMNTKLAQLENTVNQVVKKTDITNTIDINSSGMKIPNVKAIYDDIIEGKVIDQTVIDKYGTEILKYPLGIWRIGNDSVSTKFSDLPVKTSGRIEITSVDANINKTPWNSTWSYRTYTFETHSGMNYLRKLSNGGTAGVIENDTGWQKVCVTSVADVPNTVIVSENTKVKLNSNCYYTVINGVCYVILWGFQSTSEGKYLVNTSMPKTKLTMHGVCTYGSNGYEGGCAYVFYDGNGSNKLYIEVKTTEPLYGSFSYPVAE